MLRITIAELWAAWLGIKLNIGKREHPSTRTQHLGFYVDLASKVVDVTQKHHRKIVAFLIDFSVLYERIAEYIFGRYKILGLQIWISTVFRIARQFLTSACDILMVAGKERFSTLASIGN